MARTRVDEVYFEDGAGKAFDEVVSPDSKEHDFSRVSSSNGRISPWVSVGSFLIYFIIFAGLSLLSMGLLK